MKMSETSEQKAKQTELTLEMTINVFKIKLAVISEID